MWLVGWLVVREWSGIGWLVGWLDRVGVVGWLYVTGVGLVGWLVGTECHGWLAGGLSPKGAVMGEEREGWG